ncbi:MAG: YabP/YqfC family sporulation protein [Christensenellales bacterium]
MRKHRFDDKKQKLADLLDMPPDALIDLPRISILGDREVLIRGFSKILEYNPTIVRVLSSVGSIAVGGEKLVLKELEKESISVCGIISNVTIKGAS